MSIIEAAFSRASQAHFGMRTLANKAASSFGAPAGVGPYHGAAVNAGPFDTLSSARDASRQYGAVKDIPFTAIRPIAVKFAEQPIRVGFAASPQALLDSAGRGIRTKAMAQSPSYTNAPRFVQKAMVEGVEVDNSHWLIDALEEPNPYMDGWSLRFCAAVSLCATGDAYWVIDDSQERPQFYYLPKTWVTPVHEDGRPFAYYNVKPPTSTGEPLRVPTESVIHMRMADPANPLDSISVLQLQARAVNTDDEIQKSQAAAMRNGIYPGLVLRAGRLPPKPGETGQGPLPHLTPEQRRTLLDSIRLHYSGALHHGEPLIVDGMIEGVEPFTRSPAELGFLDSSQLTKNRIMHGFGVNAIVTGENENANRASAVAANETFYANVVNPLLTLASKAITQKLSNRDVQAGRKLYVWIEAAVARDDDLRLQKLSAASTAGAVTKNEWREFAGLEKSAEPDADKLPTPPAPEPPGAETTKPPPKKKRKRRDRGLDFFVKGLLSGLS